MKTMAERAKKRKDADNNRQAHFIGRKRVSTAWVDLVKDDWKKFGFQKKLRMISCFMLLI